MLEYLRNAADKPVAKVLMGILIFSFVGWGVADWFFGLTSSDTTLMRVGGDKVSVQQFSSVKSVELSNLPREEQRALYANPVAMANFHDGIIKKIAGQKRIERHARDLGYVVSNHRIANEIRAIPQFQENGKFSPVLFDIILRNSGITESDVANDLRVRALSDMVNTPVNTTVAVPDFATVATYNARNAERVINMATIRFSEFNVGTPTDEQLRVYYGQNPHRVAETRDVSYIFVAADKHKPDEYDAALNKIEKIEDGINAGRSMADVAREFGAKYVNYRAISAQNLPKDAIFDDDNVIANVFGAVEGMESRVDEAPGGIIILRVDKITPEHNAEFETIKSELVRDWTRAEREKQAYARANERLIKLNETGTLDGGRVMTVSRVAGAPMSVLVTAFKNPVGNNSIVAGADEFYVVHIDSEKSPAANSKKLTDLKSEMEKISSRNLAADYDAFLQRRYPMKINEKMYEKFVK